MSVFTITEILLHLRFSGPQTITKSYIQHIRKNLTEMPDFINFQLLIPFERIKIIKILKKLRVCLTILHKMHYINYYF